MSRMITVTRAVKPRTVKLSSYRGHYDSYYKEYEFDDVMDASLFLAACGYAIVEARPVDGSASGPMVGSVSWEGTMYTYRSARGYAYLEDVETACY